MRYFDITPSGVVTEQDAHDTDPNVDAMFDDDNVKMVQVSYGDGTHLRVERD